MHDPPGVPRPGDPSMSGRTVSVLLARAAAGDRESCAALVERVDPLLLVYARRRLAPPLESRFDAADIVNDAWSRILPHLAEIRPADGRLTRALLKYSATVINNRLRDLARAHREVATPTGPASQPGSAGAPIDLADDAAGVVSVIARREMVDRLHQLIDTLAPADREIILLRGIGQQSNEEVASVLDLRPGTVAVRYHRALDRLRRLMPASAFDDLFAEDA